MTSSIDDMTDMELIAALMRGQRSCFKQGYSALNAVMAVCDLRPEADQYELRIYAAGYAAGLRQAEDSLPGPDDLSTRIPSKG